MVASLVTSTIFTTMVKRWGHNPQLVASVGYNTPSFHYKGNVNMYLCSTLQRLETIQFSLRAIHSTTTQYVKIRGPLNFKLYQ